MPRKPPGTAVDPRNGQKHTLSVLRGQRFDPPANLGPEALEQWDHYWEDPVSQLVTPADRSLLKRWITDVDRYFRVTRLADQNPITRGSHGQETINPAYAYSLKIAAEIAKCEAQLGIGPKNRAALGIAVIQEKRSLADLNADYETESDSGDDDPRLKIVAGSVISPPESG